MRVGATTVPSVPSPLSLNFLSAVENTLGTPGKLKKKKTKTSFTMATGVPRSSLATHTSRTTGLPQHGQDAFRRPVEPYYFRSLAQAARLALRSPPPPSPASEQGSVCFFIVGVELGPRQRKALPFSRSVAWNRARSTHLPHHRDSNPPPHPPPPSSLPPTRPLANGRHCQSLARRHRGNLSRACAAAYGFGLRTQVIE